MTEPCPYEWSCRLAKTCPCRDEKAWEAQQARRRNWRHIAITAATTILLLYMLGLAILVFASQPLWNDCKRDTADPLVPRCAPHAVELLR